MSTAKTGLPTSLTPDVLREILRYEPHHWKPIKTRLVRKHPTVWEGMSVTDEDFYDQLHERLRDPVDRHEFAAASRQRDSRHRPRALYRAIFKHYFDQLSGDESFLEQASRTASPRDIVDAISHYDDDDRLTNVLWALLEDGSLSDDDVSEVAAEHSGVRERFASVVDGDSMEAGTVVDRWEAAVSRIKDALEDADSKGPDSSVVGLLTRSVGELREIALEAEAKRSADFSSSLVELLRKHQDVLSGQSPLKPYVDRIEKHRLTAPIPEDGAELLEKLHDMLHSLAEVVEALRNKSEAIRGADAEERIQLFKEMNELHATEGDHYLRVERLLLQLLDGTDFAVDTENATASLDPSPSAAQDGSGDAEPHDAEVEDLIRTTLSDPGDGDRIVPKVEDGLGPQPEASQSDGQGVETSLSGPSDEDLAPGDTCDDADSVGDALSEPIDSSFEEHGSQSADALADTTPVSNSVDGKQATLASSVTPDAPPLSTEPCPPDERHSSSAAMEALDGMLSSRRFARAYWLTRADFTLGDSNLFGALTEGARIGPGDPCPGALVHFFDGLARRKQWQDDERLLLSASVLGSCLFVDPLPQDIYQLAGEFPVESSSVGPLMQRVRELCVFQNAKIRPEDLGVESADLARNARLDQLRSDADQFLKRVPHIRFLYAPADFALQFLYRAGSEWHRLHTIVLGNHINRLNEARALVKLLDPAHVVATLHDATELTTLKQPLEGRARDKLARHLHDTLALGRQWIRLASAAENGDPSGNRTQLAELLSAIERLLPNARRALVSVKGRGAVDALDFVLEDLEARIQGRDPKEVGSIFGDLRLLPGLILEDDLEPAEGNLDDLRSAILEAEQSEPEPEKVLSGCLSRREYRRARDIIEICQLGERAHGEYRRAVSGERSTLEDTLRELELEIEDAFLLGQLRDDAEEDESVDDQARNALERSQLLAVVRDARSQLRESGDSEGDDLRDISRTCDEVSAKVKELTSRRQERLRREFDVVMEQLPQTDQGDADRAYLREAFDGCIRGNDHVAAFDLLDRGRRAAQDMEPVARATTGSSEELELFLRRADEYQAILSERDWLSRVEDRIRNGSTLAEIAFGQLDRARLDEASSAVRTWHSMTQLRFPRARRDLAESMEQLLRFVGFPLQAGGVDVVGNPEADFAHVRATLSRPITSSPLPAFGSACGSRFEVVVCRTRKEPAQFEEYIRGSGLAGRPVLAVLLPPQTSAYRIQWQRHFARSRLTVLPFDLVFLLHLCGERNCLPVLFELGLPFTWARPYIIRGENVASEMFVGRRNETEALMDPRGSCIVFGGRQLGKSALLRHVHRENHDPGKSIYVVYLDVDDLGTDSQAHDPMMPVFWRRVYDELVRCGAIPELPQKLLDKDARFVDEVPNSIATRLSENPHMRLVLLLDETDDLLDCDSGRDFALVRRLRGLMANSERRFKVVFAGLQSVQRYYNWKNHPFAQLGEELVVNPLPPAAAQELIIRPLRALGFAFENTRLVLRILSQTNYHPGLIQIFGYRLLDNLFEKWQRQDTAGPIRQVAPDDILGVERDTSVMEDIRSRFDWTLDLDDRYKVLTYALVLTPDPTAPRRESEFMAIGATWWKTVFEDMDAQGLRAVLDEMVGLGVLLREHEESVRTYRLRSPNLLRLLGPQEAIEAELLRIIDRDRVSRPNPRNFHPTVDRKAVAFGPMTNEQVGQISGHRRPFQLTLVTGSEALGLNAVERQFDKLLDEAGEGERTKAWRKVKYAGPADADAFVKKLRDALKSRRRTHRYAVVRLCEVGYEGELSALFNRLVRELGQSCTNESKAHLVLLLDPGDSWRWLRDRNREHVLSQSRVTGLELRRWSDGAIANAFNNVGARTGSQLAGDEVFNLTSGFHWLVDQGLSRAKLRSGVNASTLVPEWESLCGEVLIDGGTDTALLALGLRGTDPELESCVWEVLRFREENQEGRLVLTKTSFDLAAEELTAGDRELFETHAVQIREWMRTMDLVRPLNTNEEGSMAMASWVKDVIVAAEG